MTLEEAIQNANGLVQRQQEEGAASVTDAEIREALAAIRSARSVATTSSASAKKTSKPLSESEFDELFG